MDISARPECRPCWVPAVLDGGGCIDAAGGRDPIIHEGIAAQGDEMLGAVAVEQFFALLRRNVGGSGTHEGQDFFQVGDIVGAALFPLENGGVKTNFLLEQVGVVTHVAFRVGDRNAGFFLDDGAIQVAGDDQLRIGQEQFFDVDVAAGAARAGEFPDGWIEGEQQFGIFEGAGDGNELVPGPEDVGDLPRGTAEQGDPGEGHWNLDPVADHVGNNASFSREPAMFGAKQRQGKDHGRAKSEKDQQISGVADAGHG
jgi:hypothetical protein